MKGNYKYMKGNYRSTIENIRHVLNKESGNISDERALEIIEAYVFEDVGTKGLTLDEKARLIKKAYYTLRCELGILQPYIEDEAVSEIMVNGCGNIFIEKAGKMLQLKESFDTTQELEEVIRRIAARVHREINELNPIVDARLTDGSRVNAVYKNVALDGPILTIRKFPQMAIDMEKLIKSHTITEDAAQYLKKLVEAGYNIFVSGGTSTGKTTFLNVLSSYIPSQERVIVIEDSAELQIQSVKNLVRMECRNANIQGKGEVNMSHLIKSSLRMRPDRLIVGEVRGGEVREMLNLLQTGHEGSMSTGHGNSAEGMLRRMETMFLQSTEAFPVSAIRAQIVEGIDIIVHLSRFPDRSRHVMEISEIEGLDGERYILNPLFRYEVGAGLKKTGNELKNKYRAQIRGIEI